MVKVIYLFAKEILSDKQFRKIAASHVSQRIAATETRIDFYAYHVFCLRMKEQLHTDAAYAPFDISQSVFQKIQYPVLLRTPFVYPKSVIRDFFVQKVRL